MSTYTYVFLSLRDEQVLIEMPLYGVYAQREVNGPGQFNGSFQLDQSNFRNADLINATTPGKTWVVMERDGTPVWWGVVWSRTYQSQSKSCQIYAWGFEAYAQKRKITSDLNWTDTPNTTIFCDLWRLLQQDDGGNLNINVPAYADGPLKSLSILATDQSYYNQPMDNLSTANDGFDWTIDLAKNPDGTYTKTLRVGYPTIGTSIGDPNIVVFEYPGAILNYYATESMADAGTNVFVIGAGEGSAMPQAETIQTEMLSNQGWPRWDVDVSYKDITDQDQITSIAEQQKIVRKPPMPTYSVQVKGDRDPILGTYGIGDSCKLVITDARHPASGSNPGISVFTNVIGMEITPNSADSTEEVTVTLPSTVTEVVEDTGTDSSGDNTGGGGTDTNPVTIKYGVAIGPYPNSGNTKQQEYDAYVSMCGQPDYLRCYLNSTQSSLSNFPTTWPVAGELSDFSQRGTCLSFKPDFSTWNAGGYDSKIAALIAAYPGKFLDLCVYHEPEDNVEAGDFTLATWKTAMTKLVSLCSSINDPRVTTWAIMGGYTWESASHRNPDDWFVSGVQGYGVDTYNDPSARHDTTAWRYPTNLMTAFNTWADGKGVLKGWIEIGCAPDFNDVNKRAGWISEAATFLTDNNFARASYFDLVGPKADWDIRAIVKRTAYFPSTLGTVTSVVSDPVSAAAWRTLTGK